MFFSMKKRSQSSFLKDFSLQNSRRKVDFRSCLSSLLRGMNKYSQGFGATLNKLCERLRLKDVGVGNPNECILLERSVSFPYTPVHSYSSLIAHWDHSELRSQERKPDSTRDVHFAITLLIRSSYSFS